MVIDRMCLIIFTLFTIIATITVLLSAPHIIVTWFRKASLPPVVPGPTRVACRAPASTDAARDALTERPPLTGFRRVGFKGIHLRVRTPLRFGDLRVRKKAIRGVTSFLYDIHNNTSKNENDNTIDNENNDNSTNNNYVIVTVKLYHIIIPQGRLSETRWHTVYKRREHTRENEGHLTRGTRGNRVLRQEHVHWFVTRIPESSRCDEHFVQLRWYILSNGSNN